MKRKVFALASWAGFLVSVVSEWGLDIDLPLTPALWLMIAAFTFFATSAHAALTTNSWKNSIGGFWDTTSNWSLGVAPSSNQAAVLITNAATKTVTIDDATASIPAVMTISNLTVRGFETNNTLFLKNSGTNVPLRILNGFTLGSNAVLRVTNSVLRVDGLSGGVFSIDGSVTNLARGQIIVTNTTTIVGDSSRGSLILVDGLLHGREMFVGNAAGSQGTLTIAGGTNSLSADLDVGLNINATGAVWLTGGQLTVTNGPTYVGFLGVGLITVSNGTWLAGDVSVGQAAGSQGTLTVAGGTNTLSSFLSVGGIVGGDGTVWLTGGQLTVTNDETDVGSVNIGRMTVSNGTWLAKNVLVGVFGGSQGTLTLAGGSTTLVPFSQLVVGDGATGAVWLTGGQLAMTNSETDVGLFGVGQMTVSNGTWLTGDVLVGTLAGSLGTLTVAGGTTTLLPFSKLMVGANMNSTGAVWLTGGQLTVANNQTVVGQSGVGQMAVTNGTWLALEAVVGDSGGSQGALTIAGGTNLLQALIVAGAPNATGAVWLTGGQLTTTNAELSIGISTDVGYSGVGQMTVSNGLWQALRVYVGFNAGSQGTLTIAGGTNTVAVDLEIGENINSTGVVWLTGGRLVTTNFGTFIGVSGAGQMTVSNGIWLTKDVFVGLAASSRGTLTIAGGTNLLPSLLAIGVQPNATGAVFVTGGQLTVTNASTVIGSNGVGQVTQSGGTMQLRDVRVASNPSSRGTLTVAGGTSSVYSNLIIGNFPCTPTGAVVVAGGNLFVTNSTVSAILEVRTGTFTLNSGIVVVDKFVMTNSCAHFIRTGGNLFYGTAVLNAALDDDGDGIPNGYETSHGLDPLNPADASADNDGDGFSNLQEYLAGTDPNDSASSLRITSITQIATNILVTWQTAPGRTNALQRTAGDASGSYSTNNFADIFTITNTVGTITNYLDVGAVTNFPSRYYRVRLVP